MIQDVTEAAAAGKEVLEEINMEMEEEMTRKWWEKSPGSSLGNKEEVVETVLGEVMGKWWRKQLLKVM